jgi:hypothetical protein
MKRYYVMGLFSNFEEAFATISDIRQHAIPGVSVDDVTLKSPIEHPEIEEVLGDRGSPVPKFTLFGALFGLTFGFLFLASAQANFLVQPQGGKPVVPLPSNFVLTYEMLILFGVISTLIGFLINARMMTKRHPLYSEKVSLDQVGVMLELDEKNVDPIKDLFKKHKVLEIREEVSQ